MPTYEYKCKACGNEFEYQQRISDPPKSVCEQCGGTLEKLISRSSFLLKGSGWYKDLYSSPKPASGSSESGGSGKESAGSGKESSGSSKESSGSGKESAGSGKESAGGGSSDSGAASTSSTTSSTAAAGK
jgi:putative FmdB family regulatory protein